ncbi:uncharacterized protein LOC134279113 [Saccostrea cucullata]|uniref:uncharacterized protein LOC134279113 n=1 Tax=Saccostrea cuccullata TaxID=36930 RepID=UPI002ECFC74B
MNTLSLVEVIEHDHFYTHDNNEERERNGNGQFKGETRKPSPHEDVGHDHSYSSLPTSSSTSDDCEMCIDENIDENPDENIDENDSESDKCDDEDPCTYSTHHSVQGRHIVELDVLAEGLEKGCSSCGQPLQLTSYIGESRYGLGSLLHLRCSCKKINYVPTGKRHSKNIWDVNSKLGAAMIFCGIGESVVNNLLAALNLPNISPTTLKRREREAGSAFEAVATETCSDAIAAESRSCQSEEDQAVSFDAGWQTRGSGRNYASLSGHGSMIGVNTGKVLSYAVRCKKCRFCDRAVDKENPKEHDCRKNWEKSSKAMESDMAVEMLHELKSKGFHVKKLIMDRDTTTISRL